MEPVELAPGMIVAERYRLEAEIGHGGFSHVYRATELRLEREVALKLLSRDSVDSAGAQRFRREAELARKLEHPNTVRLLDFDLEAKPLPFIAYELLSGESLDQLLRGSGAISEERAARLATQVLKSLMEAHKNGIVHRDVKPANVFVCNYAGESDFVKVLDFGIAKSTSQSPDIALTAAGTLVGTPRYMPPEQIRGADPSPAMDLYAVGMMLAEMLLGVPVLRGTPVEACLEQLKTERVPLPEVVLRSALGDVVSKATEKNLEARYQDAAQMIADIESARPKLSSSVRAGFSGTDAALPSGQVVTQVMADPSATAADEPPPASGLGDTVYAPLEVEVRDPAPRARAARSAVQAPARAAGAGHARWVVAAVVALLGAMTATALLVIELSKPAPPAPSGPASAPGALSAQSGAVTTREAPSVGPIPSVARVPSVILSITSEPAGAEVTWREAVVCSSTPCEVEVPEHASVVLSLRKGELSGEARVLAQRSQKVKVQLSSRAP